MTLPQHQTRSPLKYSFLVGVSACGTEIAKRQLPGPDVGGPCGRCDPSCLLAPPPPLRMDLALLVQGICIHIRPNKHVHASQCMGADRDSQLVLLVLVLAGVLGRSIVLGSLTRLKVLLRLLQHLLCRVVLEHLLQLRVKRRLPCTLLPLPSATLPCLLRLRLRLRGPLALGLLLLLGVLLGGGGRLRLGDARHMREPLDEDLRPRLHVCRAHCRWLVLGEARLLLHVLLQPCVRAVDVLLQVGEGLVLDPRHRLRDVRELCARELDGGEAL
mmetsp:Transcript_11378/g.19860  ORF Transcript_11378/g.19860 Transcript_11378/m.19860 type:complete len:272 (-) Transcript_11378:495-1310(-)